MKVFTGSDLIIYKQDELSISSLWNRRDFVSVVQDYFNTRIEKILAVGGLRGTGKTVGILQAAEGLDACYMLAAKNDGKSGSDYIDFLKNTEKKYIIIDEYSWIDDREELDYYLLTAVQDGKRIVITGTESIMLDFLNYGALCHRISMVHTTMFSYNDYLRVYNLKHSKNICTEYLKTGGLFKEYAVTNYSSMKQYIDTAIVKNLAAYLSDEMDEVMARTLTYSVFYKAVCPSNLSTVPVMRNSSITLKNYLDVMGIDSNVEIKQRDLRNVAEIFEHIGLIVRIPNFDDNGEPSEQYYITNPSITCQLILRLYDIPDIAGYMLGHVFESVVMVQLAVNKLSEHKIYFYNNGGTDKDNKELDIIITDREHEFAYLFECKFSQNSSVSDKITLLSGYLEKGPLKYTEIEGRYIIYTGKPCVKKYNVGNVVFTPISRILDDYFAFKHNVKLTAIKSKDGISYD